eukprot:CAMPEP_0196715046 /NCGR_PEP_ID=MMETSP1090-20130531/76018_1 /TAXON_ID=37098 /ORGANISM="Isochrysis sp, Strain CCMP1244" /LENGTH=405 /DNA_ID=CAMNT_0042055151 /DNA_START=62 /DNA_END=1277 /DNA_ORIENTATION=-
MAQTAVPLGSLSCPCCFRPGAPLCEDFTPFDMALKVAGMRSLLKAHSLAAYLVPSGDAHSSEYVSEADKRREWLTGFTGSAGTALVTADKALVWTDGRYFVQAAKQLSGTEWLLMRSHEPGVPTLEEWVRTHLPEGAVGADPRLISIDFADGWAASGCLPLRLVPGNLVDAVWKKRPPVSSNGVLPLGSSRVISGLSGHLGSSRVISGHLGTKVCEAGCSALILNALDQLCWLFNLRGSDIECNPVFLGYAVLTASPGEEEGAPLVTRARLFLRALDEEDEASNAATVRTVRRHLDSEGCGSEGGAAFVELAAYSSFGADEAALRCGADGLVMLERGTTTMAMAAALPDARRRLVDTSPVEALKARKNEAEVAGLVSAGRKDAAALCSYFAWLEAQMVAGEPVTE